MSISGHSGPTVEALRRIFGRDNLSSVIRSLANDLLLSCGSTRPPFSPFELAKSLKVPVIYDNLLADGVFISTPGEEKRILLRTPKVYGKLSIRRLNFTLAHELGHFVIDDVLAGSAATVRFRMEGSEGMTDVEEERLCDLFASELLMPERYLLRDLATCDLSPAAILDLCDRYQVSLKAMLIKVATLSQQSVTALIWKNVRDVPTVDFATPVGFQRARLIDTGKTSVERAFIAYGPQTGRDTLLVGGRRIKGHCVSDKLAYGKVLTVMLQGGSSPFKPRGSASPKEIRPDAVSVVKQPFLPFDS